MLNQNSAETPKTGVATGPEPSTLRVNGGLLAHRHMQAFLIFVVILSACFVRPLSDLGRYALHSAFFSYIPLIPVISVYLVWLKKAELPQRVEGSIKWAVAPALGGIALLVGWRWAIQSGWADQKEDYLTFAIASYVLLVAAGCLACLGRVTSRLIAFPIAFLAFMIPMPAAMLDAVTSFFQYTSAYTAVGMLKACFMPVYLTDLTLNLPAFKIVVAPECSGIHSTMVLLITALLAGHMFLRSKWKRLFLVALVIPLAIARNGFRIFVISELCVNVNHNMIDSPIHHRGGPIFFALSLIPFFAVLFFMRNSELRAAKNVDGTVKT